MRKGISEVAQTLRPIGYAVPVLRPILVESGPGIVRQQPEHLGSCFRAGPRAQPGPPPKARRRERRHRRAPDSAARPRLGRAFAPTGPRRRVRFGAWLAWRWHD